MPGASRAISSIKENQGHILMHDSDRPQKDTVQREIAKAGVPKGGFNGSKSQSRAHHEREALLLNSPQVVQQQALSERVNNSSRVLQQKALNGAAQHGPRMVAQMLRVNAVGRNSAEGMYDTERPAEFANWVGALSKTGPILTNLMDELHQIAAPNRNETVAYSVVKHRMDASTPQQKDNTYMSRLPADQWRKLFIDKGVQRPGTESNATNALKFDNQSSPGYYSAMSSSFEDHVATAVADARVAIDADDYTAMHTQVADWTLKRRDDGGYDRMPLGYSGPETRFGVFSTPPADNEADLQLPSLTGLREMAAEGTLGFNLENPNGQLPGNGSLAKIHYKGRQALANAENPNAVLHPVGDRFSANVAGEADTARERIQAVLDRYYAEIDDVGGATQAIINRGKLGVIVKAIRALHVGHFFQDANGRLNTMTLLNKFLIEEGFTPVIMDDTGAFGGGFSIDQLIAQVVRGMRAFGAAVEFETVIPEVDTNRRYGAAQGPRFSVSEHRDGTLFYTVNYENLVAESRNILTHYRQLPGAQRLLGNNITGALSFSDPSIAERLERQLEAHIL